MRFGLIILYPVLVHLGVVFAQVSIQVLAILALTTGICLGDLIARKPSTWALYSLIVAGLSGMFFLDKTIYLLYIPPILIPLLMFIGFFRTLLPGQIPLVTDIGTKARGTLTQDMQNYTRVITQLWAACFAAMTTWALVLPIMGSLTLWSIFTNIVNHFLVGTFFVGEYCYRRYRFKDHDHPSFFAYLQIVVKSIRGEKSD